MGQSTPNLDGLKISRAERPPPRRGMVYFLLAFAAAALIAIATWSYRRTLAVEVRTATAQPVAETGGDRTVLNASGYVTARREATVSSKVTGKVDEILVEEGVGVAAGQVLARLDQTNVKANLDLARAQAAAATAALEETAVRLKEAEQELQRQSNLQARNVAAQADFDHAEAAALAFRARLEQQRAEARVAQRSVAVWEQQLEDTIIRAPFAGTVTSKNAQPGEMISPMSTGGFTRTGICTIVDMQSLEIEIDVNESYINRVQGGQPVEATLDAYPDWRIPCHVIAIIPTADRTKSTVRVRVGFNQLDPRILPDMSAKVAFRETGPAAARVRRGVTVPSAAIVRAAEQPVVFVVQGDRAERRAVAVDSNEGDTTLINAGVTAGERVVISPPAFLRDGTAVKEANP